MSTRNKIIISVSTLCLVAVVAVVAIVAVFANATQTVSSNVSVTYKAVDVIGTVKANAYVGTEEQAKPFTGDVSFVGNENSDLEKSLQAPSAFEITRAQQFVVFEFIFTNGSSKHAYTAKLDFTKTALENITVTVNKTGNQLGVEEKQWTEDITDETSGEGTLIDASFTVPASGTKYAYVLVAIEDDTLDASFAGAFKWTLTNV